MTREEALKNAIVTLEKKSAVLAAIEEFQETRPPARPPPRKQKLSWIDQN
jgi:hypothetical protein